jgi:hypothetical protein
MPRLFDGNDAHFIQIPQADPTAARAGEQERLEVGKRAVEALLPEWASKPCDTLDDGSVRFPSLPDGATWEHLSDSPDVEDTGKPVSNGDGQSRRVSWLQALLGSEEKGSVASPIQVVGDGDLPLRNEQGERLKTHWKDPLSRLRQVAMEMAQKHHGAEKPLFHRSRAGGRRTDPLPDTSLALMGVRASVGRSNMLSAEVEADRLFMDPSDLRHGSGVSNVEGAPMDSRAIRQMKPGERYKITSEQALVGETGLKYTPTPLPGVTSGMFHDVGPFGQVDFSAALEGEAQIEITRGFGSEVALTLKVEDQRVNPGKDRSWKIGVGAYLDSSWLRHGVQFFSKVVAQGVEDELGALSDRQTRMEKRIDKGSSSINRGASASLTKHHQESEKRLAIYEMVFDLSSKQARESLNQILGAGPDGRRTIDLKSLENVGEKGGVHVVRNHMRTASTRAIEKTLALFGYASQKVEFEENATLHSGTEDAGHILEKNLGVRRRSKKIGHALEVSSIGRVKTMLSQNGAKDQTAVGFGWRFKLDAKRAPEEALRDLAGFAEQCEPDQNLASRLDKVLTQRQEAKGISWLGLGPKKMSESEARVEFEVELNVEGVRHLLSKMEGDVADSTIWPRLAEAYGRVKGLEHAPVWPHRALLKEGIVGSLKRGLARSHEERTFLRMSRVLSTLKKAHETQDPTLCARHLSQAFDLCGDDLAMVGVLVGEARKSGTTAVHTTVKWEEQSSADQPAHSNQEPASGADPLPLSA